MRKAKKLLAVSLAAVLLLAGCSGGDVVEADAPVSLGTAVEVEQLQRSTIRNELTYIGQVEPQVSISVASKLAAEVMEVRFDIGDYVNEGDVLFTVDAKDIQDQIRQLQAAAAQTQVAVAQAEYGLNTAQEGSAQERMNELQYETGINTARYGTRSAEQGRESAKDGVDAAEAASDAAYSKYILELDKQHEMEAILEDWKAWNNDSANVPIDFIEYDEVIYNIIQFETATSKQARTASSAMSDYMMADQGITTAKNARDNARIGVNQADSSLDLAYDSYEAYKEFAEESKERAIRQAEFGVQTAQAAQNSTQVQLSIAESALGHAVVKSPISGVISNRSIEVGQMISQATLPFTIIKMDTVNVQVNVSETLINTIHAGDEVQVVIQSVREEPFTGVVTAVSPAAGANSTYPVRIQLDNEDGLIKPGMFSQVTFVQAQKENTFVVNKNVVMSDETTQYVYVVDGNTAKKTTVTTGLANGTTIEILSGVSIGDEIVVVGQEYLYDNVPVNIVKRNGAEVVSQVLTQQDVQQEDEENSEEDMSEEAANDEDDILDVAAETDGDDTEDTGEEENQ